MQNPFLVLRFALFALLIYIHIVVLIFASWNVHATKSSGTPVPGVVIFAIYNCCMIFLLIPVALIELIKPSLKAAQTRFECAWTAILSVFEIGAAFSVTINGPLSLCQPNGNFQSCASSTLLTLASWFGTMTLFGYFLVLFIATATHSGAYPKIWSTTVYAIPWFDYADDKDRKNVSEQNLGDHASEHRSSWNNRSGQDNAESGSINNAEAEAEAEKTDELPNLPVRPSIRRGIDNPFRRVDRPLSKRFIPPLRLNLSPEARMQRNGFARADGSQNVETIRNSQVPVSPSQSDMSYYGEHGQLEGVPRVGSFPVGVDDHEKPLPLPKLSEWIRADRVLGAMSLPRL